MMDILITDLFKSKEIDDCIYKMLNNRPDLVSDFKSEVFLILLENREKIKDLDKNQLKFYAVRVIINLATQKRNIFHRLYLNCNNEIIDVADDHDYDAVFLREIKQQKLENKLSVIDDHFGTFYYSAVIELLKKHKTIRAASRAVGIPKSTLAHAVKVIREYLQ